MMNEKIIALTTTADEWGASDLFLAAGQPVRLKVKGVVHERADDVLTDADMDSLCRACGVHAEGLKDHDTAWISPGGVRFRVNIHRRLGRLAAVMRRIRAQVPNLEALGLPANVLYEWLQQSAGLILITGPTGCGKSTAVASSLEWLSAVRSGHFITIEDPVEYVFHDRMAFFTQREVGMDTPDYSTGLARALRQAPDVIFLGEIREPKTALTCLQAAETGHLVLSTMHAASITEAFDRLANLMAADERDTMLGLLANKLLGVLSLRLLNRVDGPGQYLVNEYLTVSGAARDWIRKMDWPALSDHLKRGDDPMNKSFLESLVEATQNGVLDPDLAASHAGNAYQFNRAIRGLS